jgi:predicted phosphodiesterase
VKIAIISDIHEDVASLKKALAMIEREKCDHIVCLGDTLGYPFLRARYEKNRNVSECISLLKSYCTLVVKGNHDLFHVQKFPDFKSGYSFPKNWYDLSPEEKTETSKGKVWNYTDDLPMILKEKEAGYIASLPEFAIPEFDNLGILFSHFFYPNFTGYVSFEHKNGRKAQQHFSFLKKNNVRISICGHLHIEGLGVCFEPEDKFMMKLFNGFNYYSYGERKLKHKPSCISIPALADNGQVNGFAIIDTSNFTINAISLNTNRRFIM